MVKKNDFHLDLVASYLLYILIFSGSDVSVDIEEKKKKRVRLLKLLLANVHF